MTDRLDNICSVWYQCSKTRNGKRWNQKRSFQQQCLAKSSAAWLIYLKVYWAGKTHQWYQWIYHFSKYSCPSCTLVYPGDVMLGERLDVDIVDSTILCFCKGFQQSATPETGTVWQTGKPKDRPKCKSQDSRLEWLGKQLCWLINDKTLQWAHATCEYWLQAWCLDQACFYSSLIMTEEHMHYNF